MNRVSPAKLVVAVVLLVGIAGAIGYDLISGAFVTVPPGNYYPLASGNEWTYNMLPGSKTYDEQITQKTVIDGRSIYAVAIDDSYSYMGKIDGSVYQFGQGEPRNPKNVAIFNTPELTYQLPFVVGNDWEAEVPSEALVPTSETTTVTGDVEDKETVTVPAGTFKNAVKVLIDDPRDAPSEQTEIWFAANIGIVKTVTYTVIGNRPPRTYTTELTRYKVLPESQ